MMRFNFRRLTSSCRSTFNNIGVKSSLCKVFYRFIFLTPYQYTYVNYSFPSFYKSVDKFEQDYWGTSYKELVNNLKNKYSKIIDEIRGRGFLIGIKLKVDQTTFIKKLMDNKLLTIRAAENVVRVLPPLDVNKKEIDEAISIIEKVCKKF